MSKPNTHFISIRGLADSASIRSATFDGDSYLVVPVVALIGNVIVRPMNSLGPELVPAEELAAAPAGWNGRPIIPTHPDNGFGSANEPEVLESSRFGHIFNAKYVDGRLKLEAWLDKDRAEKVGQDALSVIDQCEAGEMVEVSVGAFVSLEKKDGTLAGQPYEYVWHNLVPDHLAMGLAGCEGACNIEMGCGGMRTMQRVRINKGSDSKGNKGDKGGELPMPEVESLQGTSESESKDEVKRQGLAKRLLSSLGSMFRSAVSANEMYGKLYDAITEVEPGINWIVDYDIDAKTVVYSVSVTFGYTSTEIYYYQRTFKLSADKSTVTINDDRVQVEVKQVYEPVTTVEAATTRAATAEPIELVEPKQDCHCHTDNTNGGSMDKNTKVSLISHIIASSRSPFKEADRKTLESLPDQALTDMDKTYADATPENETSQKKEEEKGEQTEKKEGAVTAPVTTTPSAPVTSTSVSAASKNMTVEEWLQKSNAPQSVRSLVATYQEEEEERRENLISALTANEVEGGFTVEELQEMNTKSLVKLHKSLRLDSPPIDYSGRGLFKGSETKSKVDSFLPPDSYGLDKGKSKTN